MTAIVTDASAQTGEVPGTSNSAAQGGTPVAQPQAGNEERTFNQHQVNGYLAARLKEERAKWEKEQKDAAETAEAEKRGDYDKALAKERERATAAEAKATETERTARERITRAEVRTVAATLNAVDADDVYALLDKGAIAYGDDGEPTNVTALVETLLKAKPHLVKSGGTQGGAHIPGTPNASQLTQEEFRQQEKERALRSGKYAAL